MTSNDGYPGPERRRRLRTSPMERLLRPFFDLLRWIAHHVDGFYAEVGAFLAIGLVGMLAAVALFAGLAALVRSGTTQRVDDAILLWMNENATPWLDVAALEVTALGASVVVLMTLLVASAFLWLTRHRYSMLLLWAAYLGGIVLNLALKMLFDRPRPQLFAWRTTQAGHSSFPSGHAMTAMVVYATLAYLVARLEPTPALRRLTLGLALITILLVGLSRMYLGVHYPSDVLGGFIVGFAWATFCALGIEAMRFFRRRDPGRSGEAERDLEKGIRPLREP